MSGGGDAGPAAARYSAFLSYSHADSAFVRWLHRKLESYRLPSRLRRAGRSGARLAPLFLDRAELSAGPDLTRSVRDAIAASGALVVVCSPAAAASAWVGREIELFRQTHPDGLILAALHEGDEHNAFHGALLEARGPPIAADFRKGHEGRRLALLKLVAPLAGVGLDELVQRDAQRQTRRFVAVAAASVGALALACGLWALTLDAQSRARQERVRGEHMIDDMIGDERVRLKAVGRLDLLEALNSQAYAYFKGRSPGQLSDKDNARRAELLQHMAEDDIERGDFRSAEVKARQALADTGALLRARPNDPDRVYDHAQSQFWFASVRRRQGDEAGAEAGFRAYADLAYRLVRLKPGDATARLERAYANSNLATLLLQRSLDTQHAQGLFAAAQEDFEAVARLRPGDRDVEVEVEDGDAWLAEVHRLAGDYDGALKYRLKQRALITSMLASDHRDFVTRSRVVGNDLALGRIATARGDWNGALARLRKAHDEATALADTDPENMDIAQQVRAIELFEARTLMSAPAARRPSRAEVEALLGDCHADAKRTSHAELAAFCTILRARLLAQAGDRAAAAALLAPVKSSPLLNGERLSELWSIDWRTELQN